MQLLQYASENPEIAVIRLSAQQRGAECAIYQLDLPLSYRKEGEKRG
jgi:hypothetical protein